MMMKMMIYRMTELENTNSQNCTPAAIILFCITLKNLLTEPQETVLCIIERELREMGAEKIREGAYFVFSLLIIHYTVKVRTELIKPFCL